MGWNSFVILAGMRTGSNFLEANLNEYAGLACLGELFNPHFIGHEGQAEAFGMTLARREADPLELLKQIRLQSQGVPGFRLFHDHDPRVLDAVLADRRCAKVILTRSAVETYVSLKIAGETGQWRLGDMRHARSARVVFDAEEFRQHLESGRAWMDAILRRLQGSGQTGFFLTYDDVAEVEVMNGLAGWLGAREKRDATSSKTKKQNPQPLEDRVTNPQEMLDELARVDRFGLDRQPVLEPRRGPAVPTWVTAASAPLLFLPIRSGPDAAVRRWLAALDGVDQAALGSGGNQKTLRQWLREHPRHRSFAVLRDPLRRLHDAFCRHILPGAPQPFTEIRETLAKTYKLRLGPEAVQDAQAHAAAFKGFARVIQGNLAGQTSLRVDPSWASQLAVLQGFSQVLPPDLLLREEELPSALPALAASLGLAAPDWQPEVPLSPLPLDLVADDETRALVRQAYQRDYLGFGFPG